MVSLIVVASRDSGTHSQRWTSFVVGGTPKGPPPNVAGIALPADGETDTVAAMTGAIVGARQGGQSTAARWLGPLEHRAHDRTTR